jgi:hypothetical protein
MKKQVHIVENIFKGEGNYIHTKIDRVFWDKKKAEEYAEKENTVSKEHENKAGEFRVKSYPIVDFPAKQ